MSCEQTSGLHKANRYYAPPPLQLGVEHICFGSDFVGVEVGVSSFHALFLKPVNGF